MVENGDDGAFKEAIKRVQWAQIVVAVVAIVLLFTMPIIFPWIESMLRIDDNAKRGEQYQIFVRHMCQYFRDQGHDKDVFNCAELP